MTCIAFFDTNKQKKNMQRRINILANHLLSSKVQHIAQAVAVASGSQAAPAQQQQEQQVIQQLFPIVFEESVRQALEQGKPVVALESTIVRACCVVIILI